jgi:hypothetical protein
VKQQQNEEEARGAIVCFYCCARAAWIERRWLGLLRRLLALGGP